MSHRKNAYNDIKGILSDGVVIGVDKNGFCTGVTSHFTGAKKILQNLATVKAVAVRTDIGDVAYDLEDGTNVVDYNILGELNVVDYATEQLLELAQEDVNQLEKELIYNNRLTMKLSEALKGSYAKCDLGTIFIDNHGGRLPIFRTLEVIDGTLDLFVTGAQMTFLTQCGPIKIHNNSKDVDADELVQMFVDLYDADENAVAKVIHMEVDL